MPPYLSTQNPTQVDFTKVQQNPNLSTQYPNTKPVTTLSSLAGKAITDTNTQKLQQMQQAYQYVDTSGKTQTVKASSSDEAMKNAPNRDPSSGVMLLNAPANNPALGSQIKEINKFVQSGVATPESVQDYGEIAKIQNGIATLTSQASQAMQSGKYSELDILLKRNEQLQKAELDRVSAFREKYNDLFNQSVLLNTPGAKEQQLATKANELKGQIEQFKIQTEEDKFREYEGQTLGFAGGRASEIDIRAEFKTMRMNQELNTILNELGLEKEIRESTKEGTKLQLDWLANDFELQQKVQDRLTESEDAIFERANSLREEQRTILGTLLDMMQGINPDEIPSQSRLQLQSMAAQAGIPFDIVLSGLKVQYQREQFDNALKSAQEARLSKDGDEKAETLEERQANAISEYSAVFVPGATLENGIPVLDSDGYITPEAWKAAISDAPNEGLSRESFIKAFGHLVMTPDGEISEKYGLTNKEKALINPDL